MPARVATRLVATIDSPMSNSHASLIRRTGNVLHWVDDMVAELDNDRYFRWFDSGDVYSLKLAEKDPCGDEGDAMGQALATDSYAQVCQVSRCLCCRWKSLPNVVVRYSSDSVTGEVVAGRNTSTIVASLDSGNGSLTVCESSTREGKCGPCRACWNKAVPVIAYPAHGKTMLKLINLKEVA